MGLAVCAAGQHRGKQDRVHVISGRPPSPAPPPRCQPVTHVISVRPSVRRDVLPQQSDGVLRQEYAAAPCAWRCTAKCLLAADVATSVSRKAGGEPGGPTAGNNCGGPQCKP